MAFEGLWKWLVDGESFIENFFHGAIATSIADFVVNLIWGIDKIKEKSKELDEEIRKSNQDRAILQGLKGDLEKLRMDEALKHLLPADLAETLAKRTKEIQAEAEKYEWMIANMGTARRKGMYFLGEDETIAGKRVEFQKKLNELTREQFQLAGELEQATANLKKQLQELAALDKELVDIKWGRMLEQASPAEASKLLQKNLFKIVEDLNATGDRIEELKRLIAANPEKQANYTTELIEQQRLFNKLIREQYSAEDKLARLDEELKKQLGELAKNFNTMKESLSWGYDKNGKFGNYRESARLENIISTYDQLTKRSRQLAEKSDAASLEERETLMRRYMQLVKEESEIRLASLQKQREAAISNLKSMIDLVKQAKEFRETAQQGIEANTTEALKLQSRRPGEVNDNALKPVVEQQKAVREIEGKMLEVQRKSITALTNINNGLNRVIRNLGKNSEANPILEVIPAI